MPSCVCRWDIALLIGFLAGAVLVQSGSDESCEFFSCKISAAAGIIVNENCAAAPSSTVKAKCYHSTVGVHQIIHVLATPLC